jgi:hypothetical protein
MLLTVKQHHVKSQVILLKSLQVLIFRLFYSQYVLYIFLSLLFLLLYFIELLVSPFQNLYYIDKLIIIIYTVDLDLNNKRKDSMRII